VVDQPLLEQMALARQVASLGWRAQQRQPEGAPAAGARHGLLCRQREIPAPELVEIVTDELNVKAFEFVEEAGSWSTTTCCRITSCSARALARSSPRCARPLMRWTRRLVAASSAAGQPVVVQVDGQRWSWPQ
jgi:hypothetical protein